MGEPDFAIAIKNAVASWIQVCLPKPAAIGLFLDASPKSLQWLIVSCAGVMTRDKTDGFALRVTAFATCFFCYRGGLSAPTLTQSNQSQVIGLASAMPANVPDWFTFSPTVFSRGFFGNGRKLSATAVAITVGNIVRGIIEGHGNSPFLCLIRGRFAVAARYFRVYYSFNYSTSEAI